MKYAAKSSILKGLWILLGLPTILLAQNASWTGSGGDNLWNNPLNWLIDGIYNDVPGEGTNVTIDPGYPEILYNTPMLAPSIASIVSRSPLRIAAPGFVVAGTGDAAVFRDSSTLLTVTNGGLLLVPNGNLVISNAAILNVWPSGEINIGGNLDVGGYGHTNNLLGAANNYGGNITAGTTRINPRNGSYNARLAIFGGTNHLGNVVIQRSQPSSGFAAVGTEGLIISNGFVMTTGLDIGGNSGNSYLSMVVAGGVTTNTGNLVIRQGTANRASRFIQFGGLFVHEGAPALLRGHTANNTITYYSVLGGTNIVSGFVLGGDTDTTGRAYITNSSMLYIGPYGVNVAGTLSGRALVLSGGTLGASADWESVVPLTLIGGVIKAADLENNPHDITLTGGISGSGNLVKIGAGKLTISSPSPYTGDTFIYEGVLALTGSGSVGSGGKVMVARGATLDCTGIGSFTLGTGRTLMGEGTVAGDLILSSGSALNPGTNGLNGTLTINGSLTIDGGSILTFDLPDSNNATNDVLSVTGNITLNGENTLVINGSAEPGKIFPLIAYGGNLIGSLDSFTISGVGGSLSNNPTQKTIYLVVGTAIRPPTTVRWIGNPETNIWDVAKTTNWVNQGVLDYFVNGDVAVFDDLGSANSIVQITGLVLPAKVLVNSTATYEFTGSGGIGGNTTSLVKTNTGTLVINTTNTYAGPTIIGGGTLSIPAIANGNLPSPIGQSTSDPQNLQFYGGRLQYTGPETTTDRGTLIGLEGATIEVSQAGAELTINGLLTGLGGLTVEGAGTLRLANANNSYGGPTTVKSTLRVIQAGSASTNSIILDGGTLYVTLPTDGNLYNNIEVRRPSTLQSGTANNRINGAIIGASQLNIIIPSGTVLTFNGDLTNFTGVFHLGTSAGSLRFNSAGSAAGDTCLGAPNATIDLGTGSATLFARNPNTIAVGALKGGPNTRVTGPGSTDGLLTWVIGSNTNEPSTEFEGSIVDTTPSRKAALAKVGQGTLTLKGSSTYTGPTEVREGTLQVDGSLGTTPVTVMTGAKLSGSGTFGGPINIQWGGILSPGSGVGQMTLSDTLTMDYGSILWIEVDKANATYDSISSINWVFLNGITLVISNVSGAFAPGDAFRIIQTGENMIYAYINEIVPATPGPGLEWDLSTFTTDGTIRVTGTLPPSPKVTINLVGNTLQLDAQGGAPNGKFYILATTNLATPLSNWIKLSTNYFDGEGKAVITLPVGQTPPQMFYLLSIPIGE